MRRTPMFAVVGGPIFCKVPALLNPAVGPAKKLESPALSGITKRLPGWLFHTAALLNDSELDRAMFVVPKLLIVRPSIFADVPEMVVPSLNTVTPAPLMVPPLQLSGPLMVIVAGPLTVPDESASEFRVRAPFAVTVPPVIDSV